MIFQKILVNSSTHYVDESKRFWVIPFFLFSRCMTGIFSFLSVNVELNIFAVLDINHGLTFEKSKSAYA